MEPSKWLVTQKTRTTSKNFIFPGSINIQNDGGSFNMPSDHIEADDRGFQGCAVKDGTRVFEIWSANIPEFGSCSSGRPLKTIKHYHLP